jgi:hypothetical protein
MNLYDLLVNGSCHNIIYKDLFLLKYEISKYINILPFSESDVSYNIKSKLKHPSLKCDFKFSYYINNIEHFLHFSTYHTYTHSNINSVFIFFHKQNQNFNNCDFIIDQTNKFVKVNYLKNSDFINIDLINKHFSKNLLNKYVTEPLIEMFKLKNQSVGTHIIYLD